MGSSKDKQLDVPKVLSQWLFPKEAEEVTKKLDEYSKKLQWEKKQK